MAEGDLFTKGFCVLRGVFDADAIHAARDAFLPVLLNYLSHVPEPNRGPHRHFLPMPFDPPCFAPGFFFNRHVLATVRTAMDDRIVADQWGCDVPVRGSEYQAFHADYQRPLFPELPDLALPTYMLMASFGLEPITPSNGPIEIAPATHRMPRSEALRAIEAGVIAPEPVLLDIGDVLIRHPWALHRGTPNRTDSPRMLVTIRYVRRWYADDSRAVNRIRRSVWLSLTPDQHAMLRFPVDNECR